MRRPLAGRRTASVLAVALALVTAGMAAAQPNTPVTTSEETNRYHDVSITDSTLTSAEDGSHLGHSISGVGDVTQNGHGDVLVGAPRLDANTGAVYLFEGPVDGDLSTEDAAMTFEGDGFGQWTGHALAGPGDVNADGVPDLVFTAHINGDRGPLVSGVTYIVYGPTSGTLGPEDADAILVGANQGDKSGYDVAIAGDVNGDGVDDVFVGAPFADNPTGKDSGAGYVFYGPIHGETTLDQADAKLIGEQPGARAGFGLDAAGDVNQDGHADLIIGAYKHDVEHDVTQSDVQPLHATQEDAGKAYVVYGPVEGEHNLGEADVEIIPDEAGIAAGKTVAGVGDVNADGVPDVAIAAPFETTNVHGDGAVYVLEGPLDAEEHLADAEAKLYGEDRRDEVGTKVSGGYDVNADGHDDLLIGAGHGGDNGEGKAYLVHGPVDGTTNLTHAPLVLEGLEAEDEAGHGLGLAPDLDGQGLPDVLVGSHKHETDAGREAGEAYVLHAERLDRDADGLTDLTERDTYASDPLDPDTDGDLADDGTEAACGSNPTDPTSVPTAAGPTPAAGLASTSPADPVAPLTSPVFATTCS